jgi:hypothetical protein
MIQSHTGRDVTAEHFQPAHLSEPIVSRFDREMRKGGDVSDLTWTLVIRHIDTLPRQDLHRILGWLITA